MYASSVDLQVTPDEAFALVTEPERLRRWSSVCATWRERGLDGMVTDPAGNELPAALGPAIIEVELLLHGWDLAQGRSGQTIEVSDEPTADEGASALDRFAAYSGRTALVTA